jgi:hypothetical protein
MSFPGAHLTIMSLVDGVAALPASPGVVHSAARGGAEAPGATVHLLSEDQQLYEVQQGSFGFIAVQGELDCREVIRDGRPGVEFSWEGNDDCDPASGRGWAVLEEDDSLRGRTFFHLGDDSSFTAVRGGEPTQ